MLKKGNWSRYSFLFTLLLTIKCASAYLDASWKEDRFKLKDNRSSHAVTFTRCLHPHTALSLHIACESESDGLSTFYVEGLLSYHHCLTPHDDSGENILNATWTGMEVKCQQSGSMPSLFVNKLFQHVNSLSGYEHMKNITTATPLIHSTTTSWRGFYRLDLIFRRRHNSGNHLSLSEQLFEVVIKTGRNQRGGFLSVVDWPLLLFHGVMSFVYLGVGVLWFMGMTCCWNSLLDVQVIVIPNLLLLSKSKSKSESKSNFYYLFEDNLMINCLPVRQCFDLGLRRKLWSGFIQARDFN